MTLVSSLSPLMVGLTLNILSTIGAANAKIVSEQFDLTG
jgi:hypothetical protein